MRKFARFATVAVAGIALAGGLALVAPVTNSQTGTGTSSTTSSTTTTTTTKPTGTSTSSLTTKPTTAKTTPKAQVPKVPSGGVETGGGGMAADAPGE